MVVKYTPRRDSLLRRRRRLLVLHNVCGMNRVDREKYLLV